MRPACEKLSPREALRMIAPPAAPAQFLAGLLAGWTCFTPRAVDFAPG